MRPSKDEWALELARVTARRSTCCRRSVGCVLTNSKGQVLSTGYNGRPTGFAHCNEAFDHGPLFEIGHKSIVTYPNSCLGASAPSGQSLDSCEAVHAEQNALLQCSDVYSIVTAYVTASPCITCVKLLLNTSCERVVFANHYPHVEAKELWRRSGRRLSNWVHIPSD